VISGALPPRRGASLGAGGGTASNMGGKGKGHPTTGHQELRGGVEV
jgi:hypothetical protein